MRIHGSDLKVAGLAVPLSTAIELDDLVHLSGQLAIVDGAVRGDVAEQTHLVFDRIAGVLQGLDLSLDHVVKATVWLREPADFASFNRVYAERLRPPYPVRSCVVSQLVLPDARVEIEAMASRRHVRR
jgi:2-iminobutanoate/2-iminopropanoate deaminase